MTRKEIRDELGSLINQVSESTGDFVAGFITEAEANRWAQEAYEEGYMRYGRITKKTFKRTSYADTAVDLATYVLGGDATDAMVIDRVGIKYNSTDEDYIRSTKVDDNNFFEFGTEEGSQLAPQHMEHSVYVTTDGNYQPAIEFVTGCIPDAVVTDGIEIVYRERPPIFTTDDDEVQKVPIELQRSMPLYAAYKAFSKIGDQAESDRYLSLFEKKVSDYVDNDREAVAGGASRVRKSRRFASIFGRGRVR